MSAREHLDRRLQRRRDEQARDNWERGCNMFAVVYCSHLLFMAAGSIIFGW